jgi:hypothetical protein
VFCQKRPRQPVELSHAQQEIDLIALRPLEAGEVMVELAGQFQRLGVAHQCIGALALCGPNVQWYEERLGGWVQVGDGMCGHLALPVKWYEFHFPSAMALKTGEVYSRVMTSSRFFAALARRTGVSATPA